MLNDPSGANDQFCQRCGRKRGAGDWACPACGCDVYGDQVDGEADPSSEDEGDHHLGGILSPFLLPPGFVALFYGPSGGGKSTIAMQGLAPLRRELASSRFVPPWWVSAEMLPKLILRYARRMGRKLHAVEMVKDGPDGPYWNLDPTVRRPVILDSVTGCSDPLAALLLLRSWARTYNVPAIAIAQTTKRGEIRGSARLPFESDVVVYVGPDGDKSRATLVKTRFQAETSVLYKLTPKGPKLPSLRRYYTVERGQGGALRLTEWPRGGRYADPYRHPGKLGAELPAPPLAVAAQRAPLYPAGWVEPSDVAERAEFAERHGVPFLRLTHDDAEE